LTSVWLWLVTVAVLGAVNLADLFMVDHKPHAVTLGQASRWVLFYLGLAIAFGV
jgi:hypothetical protein